jgi:hypothetical protein
VGILAKGIGGLALCVLIACRSFLIAGQRPSLKMIDLDLSWQYALEYAATHGLRFGEQIVYTYGPLGFLTTVVGMGGFVAERVLFAWAHVSLAVYLAFRVGFLLPKGHRYLPWVWLLLSPGTDVMMAAMVGVVLMSPPRPGAVMRWLEFLGLAAYGAIMLNCKFTNVVAWCGMLGAVALYYLLRGQWRSVLPRVVPFGVLGIADWLCSGQPLSGLPVYISNGLKISQGYDTIAIPAPTGILIGALVAVGVLIFLGFVGVWASPRSQRPGNLVKVLMILGCAFISWKHGFVRADLGHWFLFMRMAVPYAILLIWACPIPAWHLRLINVRLSTARLTSAFTVTLSTAALTLAFAGSLVHLLMHTGDLKYSMQISSGLAHTFDKALSSLSPDFRLPGLADLHPDAREAVALPNLSRMVGAEPVDMVTNTQVWALANSMNYAPRPVIQSIAAGSPNLRKMNLEHYLSPATTPRYALLQLGPIDNRHPWLEDAPLLLHLATQWRPLREEHGCVLLERNPKPRPDSWKKVSSSRSAAWGKWVEVASAPETLFSLQVETARRTYGRLKRFLYQGSHCEITLRLDTGEEITNLFVPELATEGFLVSPYFPSAGHFAEWRANPAFSSPHVVAFKLAPVAGCDAEFAPTFKYRISAYKYKMKARPAALPQ